MMERQLVVHPFEPIYNEYSKILILGSLPSAVSRQKEFYYGHPQNRFWKVIAAVTNQSVPHSIEEKRHLLLSKGIALWDVIGRCEISGSSDASIKNPQVNDIDGLIRKTNIQAIYTNGYKAYQLYTRFCEQKVGIKAAQLPSTSPANASFDLDRLIEAWSILRVKLDE